MTTDEQAVRRLWRADVEEIGSLGLTVDHWSCIVAAESYGEAWRLLGQDIAKRYKEVGPTKVTIKYIGTLTEGGGND